MKNLSVKSFAFLAFTILFSIFGAIAAHGQQTSAVPNAQPHVSSTLIRVGIALPKAQFAEGVDNQMMAAGVRDLVGQYLQGSNIELVPLEARLVSALNSEAQEKDCDYVLQMTVAQKKGGGGMSMFKKIAPVLGSVAPMAGVTGSVAGHVAGTVAQSAIYSAAGMAANTKSKDQFTLEYSLISAADGTAKAANSLKAKAGSDGEDVLSPMIEKLAEAILAATNK